MNIGRIRPIRGAAFVLVAAIALLVGTVRGQTRGSGRPLSLISLADIPRIQDVQLSPDGQFVSYMLARADWKANRPIPHIWKQAVAGGPPVQLTSGDNGELLARWSPDAKSLLFLAGGQIHLVAAEGGAARPLTRHATSVFGGAAPAWSPDGTSVYFLAADAPTDLERERARLRDDVFAFEEDYRQRHLWKVNVTTGVEEKVSDGAFSIVGFRLARDGRSIVTHRAPTPIAGDVNQGEIWLTAADGQDARRITSNGIEEVEGELSPDNRDILFIAEANARLDPYYAATLFVVPAAGGTPRLLLPDFPYSIERATWAPDGGAILAIVNMGARSEVFRIDVAAATATPLTNGQHSVQFWSLTPQARRMVFQLDEPRRLGDAWTLNVDGSGLSRVTGIYDTLAQDYALPDQEKVTWTGADGVAVEGLLFYPIGYQRGTRYPLMVQLHSGPQDSDKFGYGPGVIVNYVPVLAAKGYAVLRPNYRGSSGYGSAFFRDVVGTYFKNMHLDVMAGVDHLIRKGIADPDRLAVMGWSAGGHLTNKLVTFTTRFKAASAAAGVANWTSFFAETDTRANRRAWFDGLPWGPGARVEPFWNSSPIKDASNVKTPTLLIAGQDDIRVPLAQSIEMYRALVANAVPTRLYVAPREGHQWQELRHQLFKANVELEWFERYVMNRPYVWERAPGDPADR